MRPVITAIIGSLKPRFVNPFLVSADRSDDAAILRV
jgi:hypothetical protein